ncbi:MAG: hypothetical protein HUN04_24850 [Desulfobacter sp.]|nr:MAG: hypothetical protein HUN04_24850 [Desulfobacter sp.]
MVKKWKAMSRSERLQWQGLAGGCIIILYTFVFYPISSGRLAEKQKMLNRCKNRVETQTRIDNLKGSSSSPKSLESRIARIEKQIQATRQGFDELDTGFAPMASAEVRQQLLLEVSTLAERTGVTLLSVAVKGIRYQDGKTMTPVDPELGRPLLLIQAAAPFWYLKDFFQGLKDLSFYVSVMNLNLYATPPKDGKVKELHPGDLYVSLEVSI